MSSNNNDEKLNLDQQQQQQVDDETSQEQLEKQKKTEKGSEKSSENWTKRSNFVSRSAGIDVVKKALSEELTINHSLTQVYNLPIVPEYLPTNFLVSTGSSDLSSAYQELTKFFETCELLKEPKFVFENSTLYSSYYNSDLCSTTRFTCSMYRTANVEIVFNLERVDGCGMAFARLFSAFNQSLGSAEDKSRQICTFEAPPLLSSLEMNSLEKQFTNLSLAPADNCVFEHADSITSPLCWSLETLSNILSRVQNDIVRNNNKNYNEICASFDDIMVPKDQNEIIIPCCGNNSNDTDGNNDDSEDYILPLPPRAQAHMITQSFSTLNSALQGVDCTKLEPTQLDSLNKFIAQLFAQSADSNMTHLEILLTHTDIDVQIATLTFLQSVLPLNPSLVSMLPVELITNLYENAVNATENAEQFELTPFDIMNFQTLLTQVGLLMDKADRKSVV